MRWKILQMEFTVHTVQDVRCLWCGSDTADAELEKFIYKKVESLVALKEYF